MTSSNSHRGLRVAVLFSAMAQVLWPVEAAAQTTPAGTVAGVVTNGGAPIFTTGPNTTTVTVGGSRTIVNWNSFNVASGQTFNVVFAGTDNLLVNRDLGFTQTTINGNVASYVGAVGGTTGGNVWILNPNGIAVGSTGRFDVGGMLLSTSGLTDADILDGNTFFNFSGSGTGAATVAPGAVLRARSGSVTLQGNGINVTGGVFEAPTGSVSLIGAPSAEIGFDANLRAVNYLALNGGSGLGTSVSVSGSTTFTGRTIIASAGMADGQGNILLVDDNAANNITFQNGDVLLYAGHATDVLGGHVALNNGIVTHGAGAGGQVNVSGVLSTPARLEVYGARGIGSGSADLGLSAGGALTLYSDAKGRDIGLFGGSSVTAANLTSRDDVVLRSNGSVSAWQVSSGATVDGLAAVDVVGAADNLAGASLTGYDVDVVAGTSATADFSQVSLGLNGDYRVAAGDFLGSGTLNPVFSGSSGNFSIFDSAGGFSLGFNVLTPGNFSLSTSAGGGLSTSGTITSTNGSVTLNAGGALFVGGNVSTGTAAGRTINLSGATVNQTAGVLTTNALTGTSSGALNLGQANQFAQGAFSAQGTLNVRSDAANVLVTGATTTSGNVTLNAQNGMRLSDTTVRTNNGSVALNGAVGLAGANVVTAGNGTVAINGAVNSSGTAPTAGLTVTSADGTTFAADVGAGASLSTLTVNGASTFNGLTARATSGMDLDGVSITGGGPFVFNAGSGSFVANAVSAPGSLVRVDANGIQMASLTAGDLANGVFRSALLNANAGGINLGGGTAASFEFNGAGSLAVTGVLDTLRLTGAMGGSATLGGNNRISALGPFSSNGLTLRNVRNLRIDGVVNAGASDARIEVVGDTLQIDATGQVRGREVATSSSVFVNASGADALVATGDWTVYQTLFNAGAQYDGLNSGAHAVWGQTIGTLAPSAIAGNRYVFAFQPTLTFTTTSTGKTYGTDLSASAGSFYTASGYQAGVAGAYLADTAASVFTGAPTVTSAGFAERAAVAGGPYAINIGSGSVTGLSGYTFAFNGSGAVTVNPKVLTGTTTVATRTYDGTTNGSGTIGLSGVVSGDTVGATGTFTFVDKNAGLGKTVNLTGAMLTGAEAGNYTLSVPASTVGDILQKAITGTGSVTTRAYDGTTNGTGTITLSGVVGGDTVGAGGTFTFADKNAGTGKTVTLSGVTLTGADAGNYTLSVPASLLGDILRKAIAGTVTVATKTYDGTTAGTGTVTLGGVVAGDSVAGSATFTFGDKNAGTGKTVSVSGASLSGADAGNYSVTLAASALGDILQKALTGTATATTRTYDGTTAGSGTIGLTGVVAGDTVGATATFTYADKNAGTGKTVNVSAATLNGADAGNYTLTVPASVLGSILQKVISGTAAVTTRSYDGTTAGTGTITLSGVVAGDNLGAAATFTFADKNAGTGKNVTVSGVTTSGEDAGNYIVNVPTSALGDILRKALTGTTTVTTRTYDGTTNGSGTIGLAGVVTGDTVAATGTFTFADKNAGVGKLVNVSGVSLSGVDAANYTISVPASAVGDILRKSIAGTATVANKTYDGNRTGTGSIALSGLVAGDSVTASGSYTFSDANAGAGKAVAVNGVTLSGTDAGNYTVIVPGSTVADILRRSITVTADSRLKPSGSADPALTYSVTQGSLVTGESLGGALSRAPGELPGVYLIGQGTLDASSNYQLTFVGSSLTIVPLAFSAPRGATTGNWAELVRYLEGRSQSSRQELPLEVVDERSLCERANERGVDCQAGLAE